MTRPATARPPTLLELNLLNLLNPGPATVAEIVVRWHARLENEAQAGDHATLGPIDTRDTIRARLRRMEDKQWVRRLPGMAGKRHVWQVTATGDLARGAS